MTESPAPPPENPQRDPDRWDWLKQKFQFLKRRRNNEIGGTDGPTSPASSGLTPGSGINEKPGLTSGASGGGTRPGVNPFKDTV